MSLISGTAELSCDKCANTFSVDSWDLDLYETGSEERNMGPEVFYASVTALLCPKCGSEIELAYDVSEYPIGMVDYQERTPGAPELFARFRMWLCTPGRKSIHSTNRRDSTFPRNLQYSLSRMPLGVWLHVGGLCTRERISLILETFRMGGDNQPWQRHPVSKPKPPPGVATTFMRVSNGPLPRV
jgi:hypothetical protein